MINIPKQILTQFDQLLNKKMIPEKEHQYYKKWLRYYLDFCQKYNYPQSQRESLSHYLEKLQESTQKRPNVP